MLFLYSVDPTALGRVDCTSLPQETMIEILKSGVKTIYPVNIQLQFEFNDMEEVIEIGYYFEHVLSGTIDFRFVPATVTSIKLRCQ